jgi:hypothetical protein
MLSTAEVVYAYHTTDNNMHDYEYERIGIVNGYVRISTGSHILTYARVSNGQVSFERDISVFADASAIKVVPRS